MVRITGLVRRAPGGPQLTTGLNTVWMSSTGGLEKTDNTEVNDSLEKSCRAAAVLYEHQLQKAVLISLLVCVILS